MSLRDDVVRFAEAEVGPQVKGSPQVLGYWREVLPRTWGDVVVRQYAKEKHWCGGFALWALHKAGIARDVFWLDGLGFCEVEKLPKTKAPQPGDIAYTNSPFQHHAIVKSLANGILVTIDGNQPNVVEKTRPLPKSGMVFYSIQPFLDRLDVPDTSPPPTQTLRPILLLGSRGAAVKELQTRLNAKGATLLVDGSFGPKTDNAVTNFQRATGLHVDGIVGQQTWAKLI